MCGGEPGELPLPIFLGVSKPKGKDFYLICVCMCTLPSEHSGTEKQGLFGNVIQTFKMFNLLQCQKIETQMSTHLSLSIWAITKG